MATEEPGGAMGVEKAPTKITILITPICECGHAYDQHLPVGVLSNIQVLSEMRENDKDILDVTVTADLPPPRCCRCACAIYNPEKSTDDS